MGSPTMAYPVAETHLLEAERLPGRRLPEAMRTRLLASNGGKITADGDTWQLFPVRDPSDRPTPSPSQPTAPATS